MTEFINIEDGRVFNGDSPYVFWFENGQSVNLNYVLKICFISTRQVVEAHLDSPVFSLLNMNQTIPEQNQPADPSDPDGIAKGEIINDKLYMNLDDLKTDYYASIGYRYNDFYVHMIYILANSQEVGEIHDYFTLTDDRGIQTYEIAADFYADNEVLKTNLGNFDVHIPESIQKAIYEVDVHEEANDNITLNRKYKELLMNYWDIVANKGSYNSLQNSLAWFEWGDLVRIEELWKRHHEHMEDYFQTELNKELNYEFITEFLNNSKTTYIGLYMALSKVMMEDGQIMWQHDIPNEETLPGENRIYSEENPVLVDVITKWQLIDLCLKMTLLGNFYSTYFIPIHMDLIHSTLERWVFAYTIKVLHAPGVVTNIVINNVRTFDMIYDKRTKMLKHLCRSYSDTLFLNPVTNGPVFGYEKELHNEINQQFLTSGEFTRYHMGGTYGVVNFRISEDDPILACNHNDAIYREILRWENETGGGSIETFVPIEPTYMERSGFRASQYAFLFDFNLGFMEPGKYKLTFEFETIMGSFWTKTIEVEIEDSVGNHIDIYKVEKRDDIQSIRILPNDSGFKWFKMFQMNPGIAPGYQEHSIYIEPFMGHSADMNHTIIFDVPVNSQSIDILYNNHTYTIDTSSHNLNILRQNLETKFPFYIWILNKYSGNQPIRVIGIRRKYGVINDVITGVDNGITDDEDSGYPILRYVFHPFMHNIKKTEKWIFKTTDLIYLVPQLGHSRDIHLRNWVFTNQSTGKSFESYLTEVDEDNHKTTKEYGGMKGLFIASHEMIKLDPGYYNIKLRYLKGNVLQEYEMKSAFIMKK